MRYRWTLLATVAVALLPGAHAHGQNADSAEVYNHRLSLAELGQTVQATRNLNAALKADPGLAATLNPQGTGQPRSLSIAQVSTRLERVPAARDAITSAGMTARSYTVALMSLAVAGAQYGAVQQGAAPATPAVAANIRLYRDNQAQFKTWGREFAAMGARPVKSANPDLEQASSMAGDPDMVLPTPAGQDPDMERPSPTAGAADLSKPTPASANPDIEVPKANPNDPDAVRPTPAAKNPDMETP
jgi:hypothetical protein